MLFTACLNALSDFIWYKITRLQCSVLVETLSESSCALYISRPCAISLINKWGLTCDMALVCSLKHKKPECHRCNAGTNCIKCCPCQPRTKGRPRKNRLEVGTTFHSTTFHTNYHKTILCGGRQRPTSARTNYNYTITASCVMHHA